MWTRTLSGPTDDLRERAHQHIEHLPAETAVGNADPAGGVQEDPQSLDRAAREKGERQD